MMQSNQDPRTLRRLVGDLDATEAEALDRNCLEDPDLAAADLALGRTWKALDELPPPPTPDPYAARRWVAQWRNPSRSGLRRSPVWGSLALTLGLAVGLGLGTFGGDSLAPIAAETTSEDAQLAESLTAESATLAEGYWALLGPSPLDATGAAQ